MTNFIEDFLSFNSGNECPPIYVRWTAYGLLSAAIGPRVYLDLDYFFVLPDTYILLVGPSGGRKTASLILGRELLLEAIPDMCLAADNETYQGVISYMHDMDSTREYATADGPRKYKPYHILAEELMDYLQLNPVGMVTFLTNIYGKKFYRYRLKNEDHNLLNPYVTMCACSTPEWLTDQLKAKQFSEGYGRRSIIVCNDKAQRKRPILSDESKLARDRCRQRLIDIQLLSGVFKMTTEAEQWFWPFYINTKDPEDKFLRNWTSTRHINLLKIAMLSALAASNELIITLDNLHLANLLLLEVEKNLPMITSRMGRSELVGPAQQIVAILKSNQGIMRSVKLRAAAFKEFKNDIEYQSALQYLLDSGIILKKLDEKSPTPIWYIMLAEALTQSV